MKISKNQKTAAIVLGGSLVLYLLYRWYQNNAANTAATSASGQLSPVSTDPGTGATGGGAGDTTGGTGSTSGAPGWGGAGSGGTLNSDLQALMAQEAAQNAGLLSAIQGLTPPAAAPAVAGMVSGPLNALPVAAQIALVHAGLASPNQLGPKAQQAYSHGDTTLAQYATGQKKAGPRGPTRKPQVPAGLTTAQLRTIGSQLAGNVNHNYQPHKSGSAVAPSHHGTKPTVKPGAPPALDHQTGGTKPQPHVTPPKTTPHKKTTTKKR